MRGRGSRDAESARRAGESRRALEAGGLPPEAETRLANLAARGGGFFTSDLSTNEFLLIREAGFRPLTQVMGSCFFNIGWQFAPGSESDPDNNWSIRQGVNLRARHVQVFELTTQIQAWERARGIALSRLAQEAKLAGADAVVGVKLRRGAYGWSKQAIEFVAVGTAVASERFDLGGEPVLSNLSGQEFAKLFMNGYWPAGIVANTSVVYAMVGLDQRAAVGRFTPNQELPDFTEGLRHARHIAMTRIGVSARALQSSGIVGLDLQITQEPEKREGFRFPKIKDMIITVNALGTAIVELDRAQSAVPVSAVPVRMALDLSVERR